MLAAFCGGIFWGSLYIWRKSIPLLIISHLIFDLLFIVFFPFG
jgi:membrane protease YdiL (CAAX protease family)